MTTFSDLGIQEPILSTLTQLGFENPTPVQEKVIPHLLTNTSDVVALAQTGTGKTASFGIPMLSLIDPNSKKVQALVLCPTRELCMQVAEDIRHYGSKIPGINVCSVYGGASIENQIKDIQKGSQIVVATPGRLLDIIRRKKINLHDISYLVLDEADEMLNMGFKDEIEAILAETPQEKYVWLFSATMPPDILRISKKYMNNPVELSVGNRNQGNENIEHNYYEVANKHKYTGLRRVIDSNPDIYGIVFCRTKREVQEVAEQLIRDGYSADALHGDLSQAQRDVVMKRFREASIQLLVATDVAARGIDVNNITHVINYQLPDEAEAYTHRSGRTARAGKKGTSIVFVSKKDISKLKQIEKISKIRFENKPLPEIKDVINKQIVHRIQDLLETEISEEINLLWNDIDTQNINPTVQEVLQKFLTKELHKLLNHYQKNTEKDLSDNEEQVIELFVNIGKVDGFDNFSFKDFLREKGHLNRQQLRWVEMKGTYSFIEVESSGVEPLMNALDGSEVNGHAVSIEIKGPVKRRGGSGGGKSNSYGGGAKGGKSFSRPRTGSGGSSGHRKGNFGGGGDRKTPRSGGYGKSKY